MSSVLKEFGRFLQRQRTSYGKIVACSHFNGTTGNISFISTNSKLFLSQLKLRPTFSNIVRKYSSIPNGDPKLESRRKGIKILTYVSCAIGAVLMTAVGAREYQRLKLRARGVEPIKNRLFGRKPYIYKYRGYYLPKFAMDVMDKIHTFEVRENDIWVVTFPKAGTTWMEEIVYLIHSDLDFEGAKTSVDTRFPYLEFFYPGTDTVAKNPSPRYIKSHLPFSLLPNQIAEKKPKIIYVARNPKDTVVSYYNFSQKFLKPMIQGEGKFKGTFEDYCQLFLQDHVSYCPWSKHVLEAWEQRDKDHILFITYEELKADLPSGIRKVAAFLGKSLSPDEVRAIAAHCSFDAMKTNQAVNYDWLKEAELANKGQDFMRKGQVGDWKNHLTPEFAAKLDELVATQLLPVGLDFTDSLNTDGKGE